MSGVLDAIWEHKAGARPKRRTPDQVLDAACDPLLSPADAKTLSRSQRRAVLVQLAENPATPLPILLRLAQHGDYSVCRSACASRRVPWDVARDALSRLSYKPLYLSPHCPTEILAALADAPAYGGLEHLLSHPNAPAELLDEALAGNPDLTAQRMRVLSALRSPALTQDRYDAVDRALPERYRGAAALAWATNPSAMPEWVDRVTRERGHDIALLRRILERPDTPAHVVTRLGTTHPGVRIGALVHPACPPEKIGELLAMPDGVWRADMLRAVSAGPNTPVDVLDTIPTRLTDPAWFVLAHARSHQQAALMLHLLPQWEDTLGALVRVTRSATD